MDCTYRYDGLHLVGHIAPGHYSDVGARVSTVRRLAARSSVADAFAQLDWSRSPSMHYWREERASVARNIVVNVTKTKRNQVTRKTRRPVLSNCK